MAGQFDPYCLWLGVPPEEQPANHYRILSIPVFEANAKVIEEAAARRVAAVCAHATGPHQDLALQILNQLSNAKTTLLDAEKKASYDRALAAAMAKPSLEMGAPAATLAATAFEIRRAGDKWTALGPSGEAEKWFTGQDAEGQARNFAFQQQKMWEMKHGRSAISAKNSRKEKSATGLPGDPVPFLDLSGIEPPSPIPLQPAQPLRPFLQPTALASTQPQHVDAGPNYVLLGSSCAAVLALVGAFVAYWSSGNETSPAEFERQSQVASSEPVNQSPRGPAPTLDEKANQAPVVHGASQPSADSDGTAESPSPVEFNAANDSKPKVPAVSDAAESPVIPPPAVAGPAPPPATLPTAAPGSDAPMTNPTGSGIPISVPSGQTVAPPGRSPPTYDFITLPSGKEVKPTLYQFDVRLTWSEILKNRLPAVLQESEPYQIAAVCNPTTKALNGQATILFSDGTPRLNALYKENEREGFVALWNESREIVYYEKSQNDQPNDFCCLFQNNQLCLIEDYQKFKRIAIHRVVDNEIAATYVDEEEAAEDAVTVQLLAELEGIRKQIKVEEKRLRNIVGDYIEGVREQLRRRRGLANRNAILGAIQQRNAANQNAQGRFWGNLHN